MSIFRKIEVPHVSDLIISQIRDLVRENKLQPGDRLPSEAQLQEMFGVPRPQVRSAFKKLDIYGIVETRPQSGTYLADFEKKILTGLMNNLLQINDQLDFISLVDTRRILEVRAAELAAERMTDRKMEEIRQAQKIFVQNSTGTRGIDDDVSFHLQIVHAANSPVLTSSYCFLTPSFITFWKDLELLDHQIEHRLEESFYEHELLVQALERHEPDTASEAMKIHMDKTYETAVLLMKNKK